MAVVNRCGSAALTANPWCLSTMFADGEGDNLLLVKTDVWAGLKTLWQTLASTSDPIKVLTQASEKNQIIWNYSLPAVSEGATLASVLFPEAVVGATLTGLNFVGNNLIFNPTIANAADGDGVPYQKSSITLPLGSSKSYDELAKYIQANAWNAIKLNSSGDVMHVYGGTRGLYPQTDNLAEMMFSGNNDNKGKTSLILENAKTNVGIEYLVKSTTNTDTASISTLFGLFQANVCMVNGIEA